jgi:hypothetical protein
MHAGSLEQELPIHPGVNVCSHVSDQTDPVEEKL